MSNVVIDIVTQFSGKKAFKEADNAAAKLTGSVKKLGAALGIAFGARAIVRFAKSSASAFIEDEKATARLTQTVKNLGLALSATDINGYIERLTLQTGVIDNQLRPAMQSLLQVTGSVAKSQDLLNTAIETSRGSGESLTTVANDLSQAYVGNLKGLRKYYLGLTQAELKAMSFAEIQEKLNNTFKGSSAAYLNTFAGQWELLTTNIGEAKEVLGKGMIEALMILSGDTTIEGLSKSINDLAQDTADAITSIAEFGRKTYDAFKPARDLIGGIKDSLQWVIDNYPSLRLMEDKKEPARARRFFTGGQDSVKAGQMSAAERLAAKRAADLIKMQKAAAAAAAKAAADALKLKKAGTLFDIDQIQIIAALKGEVSKEDETRLKLQFAILTENVGQATKLAGEVANAQGLTQALVDYYSGIPNARNPFEGWIKTLTDAEAIAKRIAEQNKLNAMTPPITSAVPMQPSATAPYGYTAENPSFTYGAGNPNFNVNNDQKFNVTVMLDGQEMAGAVTKVQQNGYLSGKLIALERTLGSFN